MTYIENTYICLIAPLLLAILCLGRHARRSMMFLLAGMTACLFSAYVSAFLSEALEVDVSVATHEIAPVVEEIIKFLPVLFYLIVFDAQKEFALSGALLTAVGFATLENVVFLTSYGTSNLLRLLIRGFGTGAMHVVCGMGAALGILFLWERAWLRAVGGFALLCFVIRFHAVFNVLVNQSGAVFWIGSAFPLTLILVYLIFFRERVRLPVQPPQGGSHAGVG